MIVRAHRFLEYDSENRLYVVATPTTTNTFGYSAEGARLSKQNASGLQVWIGSHYEEKSGKILFHIMADGRRICTFDATGTNVFNWYHNDHLRSTSVLTDQTATRVQHHEYSAYGRDQFTESSTAFKLSNRFTGQVLDEDTGLYYYGARYYDPEMGRFIQPDTIIPDFGNPQALNRYAYTYNNPLKYIDPTGHGPQEVFQRVQAAAMVAADFGINYAVGLGEVTFGVSVASPISTAGYYGPQGGRYAGEAAAMYFTVSGSAEAGAGAVIGGLSLAGAAPTGGTSLLGEAAAGPMMIRGAGKVALGTFMANNASKLDPLQNPSATPKRPGNRGHPDHKADVQGPGREQAENQAGPGEQVLTERPVQGHPGINRRADNQIVGRDGKTRVVVESERRPNGPYHKQRVKELEGAGIEVQTRPIPPPQD